MKNPLIIIRIGLALVFLSNSLSAFFTPNEFRDIIEASSVAHLVPFSTATILLIIGTNDLVLSLLIFLNKYQKYILIWAMLWLVIVMVVTGDILGILEHLGFFSMALALWVNAYFAPQPQKN